MESKKPEDEANVSNKNSENFKANDKKRKRSTENNIDNIFHILTQMPIKIWAFIGLFFTGVCCFWYVIDEGISFDIFSPSFILAWPIVGIFIAFHTILLGMFAIVPAYILLIPLNKEKRSWVASFDEIEPKSFRRVSLLLSWVITIILSVLLINLLAWVTGEWIGFENRVWNISAVILLFIVIGGLMLFNLRLIDRQQKIIELIKIITIPMFTGALFLQISLVITISILAGLLAKSWGWSDSYMGWVIVSILIAFVYGILQPTIAMLAHITRKYTNWPKIILLASIGIMSVFCLIRPLGGGIAGIVFQTIASGGRKCTVLQFVSSGKQELNFLRDPINTQISKPLRILLYSNGHYQVRFWNDPAKTLYFVSEENVAGMKECPKEE